MERSIVIIEKDDVMVKTSDLAKGLGTEHRFLKAIIEKYKSEFEDMGVLTFITSKPHQEKGGRPTKDFLVNELQATYLITLLQNNEKVRKFKMFLSKEFFRQRRFLMSLSVQKQNAEWLERRTAGKIERRIETDTIKEFIEYAKGQGSKNADKYYMSISKMENSCLFSMEILQMEFPNLREVVSGFALDALKMCDHIVSEELKDGMGKNLFYKDIFIKAKERVEKLASVLGKIGIDKGILPDFKLNQKQIA